jgi:NitT/TauT family transport system ATP-binding protein
MLSSLRTNLASRTILSAAKISFSYEVKPDNASSIDWTINDLNLTVREGEIVCILGASGCGKTTFLNVIAGLLVPQKGSIEIASAEQHGRAIGYIFQQDALLPWRTVRDNLALAEELRGKAFKRGSKERLNSYMDTFNLKEQVLDQFPAQLSGGMRQRVAIIQSLMFDPQLILLDEPFSALDFYTKLRLESEFCRLVKEQGKAAILVTHDLDEAVAMADRVLIMDLNGNLKCEFSIELGQVERSPETARGTQKFAEYYSSIWAELKSVIAN